MLPALLHYQSKALFGLALLVIVVANDSFKLPVSSPRLNEPRSVKPLPTPSPQKRVRDEPRTSLTATSATESGAATRARETFDNLPLGFETNLGQVDSQVKFLSRGAGYDLFLTATEAVFSVSVPARSNANKSIGLAGPDGNHPSLMLTSVIRMQLLGSNPEPQIEATDEAQGKSNYLIGNVPEMWRPDVPNYARVRFKGVYPGIDVVYYGDHRRLEYDFVIAPGATPRAIRLAFKGAQKLRIDGRGNLVMRFAGVDVQQPKPVVYQETDGTRNYLEGHYRLRAKHTVGFKIARYDPSKPLVIDPVLAYSSFLGGGEDDFAHGIAVDNFGNVYVGGETASNDFPTKNSLQPKRGSNANAFITKINPAGSAIIYSTFLGGSGADRAYGIAVDQVGSVHLTGSTSSPDFPTRNPIQPTLTPSFNGGLDSFVAKLNPEGSDLVFSTYMGGSGFDTGYGISVDTSGNVYFTGSTGGGWPTTIQAFQANFSCCHDDAFIAKLSPNGTALLYSTYLGGRDAEVGTAIAVDSLQNAFVTGYTESVFDFPTQNPLQPTYGGGVSDAFVAKISTATLAPPFPIDSFENENGGAPSSPFTNFSNWNVTGGNVNLVINPFSSSGLIVNFDGYPPQGAILETKSALALTPAKYRLRFDLAIRNPSDSITVRLGNLFTETFTFNSLGTNGVFATVVRDLQVPAQTNAKLSFDYAGGSGSGVWLDNVALVESADPAYITFLGGGGNENRSRSFIGGIKVDNAGNAYITGSTTSIDFPRVKAIQTALAGGEDAFITKVNPAGSALVYSTYLGGAGDDFGNDLAIDSTGAAYVVGNTTSQAFPLKNAIQTTFGGETQIYGDAFATKLSATGGELIYSTYLGGGGRDVAEGVAVDSSGNALVAGYSSSPNFPLLNPIQAAKGGGQWDAFFLKVPSVSGSGLPDVLKVTPATAGNAGIVTFQLQGENLVSANVKIVGPGSNELQALNVSLKGPGLLLASFDLTGAAPGARDVVVQFTDGQIKRIVNAITITSGGQARIWTDLVGPRTIRAGVAQRYTVVVGNSGNVDGLEVPVWIKAPRATKPIIRETISPPSNTGSNAIDWSQIPQELDDPNDSITPLLIPHLPAGSTRTISFDVTPLEFQSFRVEVWANAPLLSTLLTSVINLPNFQSKVSCLTDLIVLLVKEELGKVLPVNCVEELSQFIIKQLDADARKAVTGETSNSLVSLLKAIYSFVKVVAICAVDIASLLTEVVVLKMVLDFLELMIDGPSVQAVFEECLDAFIKITGPSNPVLINVVESFDPNDKIGSNGALSQRFISAAEPLRYAIYFENKATATAPAREVTITDQLDPGLVDLSSFKFGPVNFGNKQIVPAASPNEFATDVDLRPDKNLIVRVSGKLDPSTGRITWSFISLNPATGMPPADPLAGFLPPSVHPPEGDGNVFFTVFSKAGLPNGSIINNGSSIVFDTNAAITTPTWSNTLDNSAPASHVLPLAAIQNSASFNVQWSGTDTGSGIRDYTIYVSDNGAPFTPWLTQTTGTQAAFPSSANHAYSFFSLARDLTDNVEPLKSAAEAGTQVAPVASIASHVTDSFGNDVNNVTISLTGSRAATAQTDVDGSCSFAGLPNGTYTLTPSKANYSFVPPGRTFNNLSANQTAGFTATIIPGVPVLISETNSTRALAVDSALWLREPFGLDSPVPWGIDRRTRVMLFATNLELLAGENFSMVTADAEDGSHRTYPLVVESVGRVPGFYWLSNVVVRLHDDMGDPGDVLVRIRVRGVSSNRVRLGVGHIGGGPTDDAGSGPTPGREP
jgi:hypothetical protein